MGTDIHIYTEVKKKDSWFSVTTGLVSDYYKEGNKYFGTEAYRNGSQIYQGRNYTLFAYLADVRNGIGFAGIDTGDRIEPISMPRGIPINLSLGVEKEFKSWGSDCHSHSYFYLKELKKAWKKSKNITQVERGFVEQQDYEEFKLKGKPSSWCGDITGQGIKKVSNDIMDKILEGRIAFGHPYKFYTHIEWTTSLAENVGGFFEHVIPQLDKLSSKPEVEDVRIVFWFDS